jgi:hypothetical protein
MCLTDSTLSIVSIVINSPANKIKQVFERISETLHAEFENSHLAVFLLAPENNICVLIFAAEAALSLAIVDFLQGVTEAASPDLLFGDSRVLAIFMSFDLCSPLVWVWLRFFVEVFTFHLVLLSGLNLLDFRSLLFSASISDGASDSEFGVGALATQLSFDFQIRFPGLLMYLAVLGHRSAVKTDGHLAFVVQPVASLFALKAALATLLAKFSYFVIPQADSPSHHSA